MTLSFDRPVKHVTEPKWTSSFNLNRRYLDIEFARQLLLFEFADGALGYTSLGTQVPAMQTDGTNAIPTRLVEIVQKRPAAVTLATVRITPTE